MDLQQKYGVRTYILGGLFSLLAAFPLVTTSSLDVPLEGSVTGDGVERAMEDRENQSLMRRMRWSVMKDCAQREARGEMNICPDISDRDALIRYWYPASPEDEPAVEEAITASIDDLSAYEQSMLRRAKRIGQCLPELDTFAAGLQALCDHTVQSDDRLEALKKATHGLVQEQESPSQHYRLKKQQ